jgi:hypothetical protein
MHLPVRVTIDLSPALERQVGRALNAFERLVLAAEKYVVDRAGMTDADVAAVVARLQAHAGRLETLSSGPNAGSAPSP